MYIELQSECIEKNGVCHIAQHIEHSLSDILAHKYHFIAIIIPQGDEHNTLSFISLIRQMSTIPIITAAYKPFNESLRIKALEAGADQFHDLPKSDKEIISIINALIRRYMELDKKETAPLTVILRKHIVVILEQRVVLVDQKFIELLPKEFDILYLLIQYPGRWYSPEEILLRIWGEYYPDTGRSLLWRQVHNLREKLKTHSDIPDFIHSQRGVGYRFNPECSVQ